MDRDVWPTLLAINDDAVVLLEQVSILPMTFILQGALLLVDCHLVAVVVVVVPALLSSPPSPNFDNV